MISGNSICKKVLSEIKDIAVLGSSWKEDVYIYYSWGNMSVACINRSVWELHLVYGRTTQTSETNNVYVVCMTCEWKMYVSSSSSFSSTGKINNVSHVEEGEVKKEEMGLQKERKLRNTEKWKRARARVGGRVRYVGVLSGYREGRLFFTSIGAKKTPAHFSADYPLPRTTTPFP